jgi:predicted GIY-YIG superfamily endonuclease
MSRPFFVYMLRCADGSYYVGHTDDLEHRLNEHREGGKCEYTTARRPVTLFWSEEVQTREEAKHLEAQVKKWNRAKKEALAKGDFDALRKSARKNWSRRIRDYRP